MEGATVSASDRDVSLVGGGLTRIDAGNPRRDAIIDAFGWVCWVVGEGLNAPPGYCCFEKGLEVW